MNRRVVAILGTVTLAAVLVFGSGTAAFALVNGTNAGLTYSADNTDVAAGATVTGVAVPSASVTIPDSVVINGISYNVTAIGLAAFFADHTMTSVTIPNSVTSIGHDAFESVDLTSVTIPHSVTTIGDSAFQDNPSLTSVTLGDSVTSIGAAAFAQDALRSIAIPDSVTAIGNLAFFDNAGLTSVTLGDSVATIGSDVFSGDPLTSVTIPGSVTSIGEEAFVGSAVLGSVTFLGAAPTTIGSSTIGQPFGNGTGLTLYYNWAYDASQVAGGFTTPTWRGYHTVEQATVSFNLDGHGSVVLPQNVTIGSTLTQPTEPAATGLAFTGWYTSPALTTKFDFADPVTANTTLYAGWTALALTGVDISPLTVPIGIGGVFLGIAFLIVAARRRPRHFAR